MLIFVVEEDGYSPVREDRIESQETIATTCILVEIIDILEIGFRFHDQEVL